MSSPEEGLLTALSDVQTRLEARLSRMLLQEGYEPDEESLQVSYPTGCILKAYMRDEGARATAVLAFYENGTVQEEVTFP